MRVTAIVAAAGSGTRLGGELKQLRAIAGRPILERAVAAIAAHPAIADVIVALPEMLVDNPPAFLRSAAAADSKTAKPAQLVAGGARRQDSVANAFRLVPAASEIVLIHDAARPFVSADLISRTIDAAAEAGAAIAALRSRDTVKRAAKADSVVAETLPRESIYLAQTPQAFHRKVLESALAYGADRSDEATDEAALAERAGFPVRLVDGEPANIKITTADDLVLAEAIAGERDRSGRRPIRTGRAGTGYDLHRLVDGRPLVLGGIVVPSTRGALGHSDADVVCHAITDAILGAACLGDIGRHFPDSDPRWRGASSLDLLSRAVAMIAERGFEVGNVDVTIVLEAPKLAGHVDAMRTALAGAIGLDAERISLKAKTNEGLDAVGRGEAIAAHAIALIRSR